MRLLALTLLAALAQGCVDDYGAAPFACLSSPACPQGYLCIGHVCVREGAALDASATVPDRQAERSAPDQRRGEGKVFADLARADAPLPGVVLHQDDFNSATSSLTGDGWSLWMSSEGHLVQSGSCVVNYWTTATALGKSWLDVEVAVQVRVDKTCTGMPRSYVGVVARVGWVNCDKSSYYYCILDAAGFLEVGRIGTDCKSVLANKQPLTPPPLGTFVAVALSTVGGQLTCKLTGNGAPVTVSLNDPAPLAAGSAGVAAANVEARFDNFIVVAK